MVLGEWECLAFYNNSKRSTAHIYHTWNVTAQQLRTHPFNILGQMALESNWGQSIAGAHNVGNILGDT